MTLRELIALANKGYETNFCDDDGQNPLSSLLDMVDETGKPLEPPPNGDTLALFIVRELNETYDKDAGDEDQRETAADALYRAAEDLLNTVNAIRQGG